VERRVGKNAALNWPVGLGASGNEGVSARVEETPSSIGYIELIYVPKKRMAFAQIKNRDGYYIKASLNSMTDNYGQSPRVRDGRIFQICGTRNASGARSKHFLLRTQSGDCWRR
jgi:hypothetical protein